MRREQSEQEVKDRTDRHHDRQSKFSLEQCGVCDCRLRHMPDLDVSNRASNEENDAGERLESILHAEVERLD